MRKLATAAAVSLALASGGAFGLGLGDIEMRSALNQPMNAEIRLTSVKPGELDGMIVQLASEDAFSRAGIDRTQALTDLVFTVDQSANVPVIRISSRRPVVEPFLNFLLEVDWPQGRMVREYTVLLDPPVFITATERSTVTDQPAVVQRDTEVLVSPTPIQRDTNAAIADTFEVEVFDGSGDVEIADSDILTESDVAGEGDIVSLTDLAAPNTDAIDAREAALAFDPDSFEVEVFGGTEEVSNDFVVAEENTDGLEDFVVVEIDDLGEELDDGSTIVSLDDIDTGTASDGATEVAVQQGDTLYEIATANAQAGVSVEQMMMALLEANQSAFIQGNINLVRAGEILRIPNASEATTLSQSQALAAVGQQGQLWQEYRDNLISNQPTRLAGNQSSDDNASSDTVTADATSASDASSTDAAGVDATGDQVSGNDSDATGDTASELSSEAQAILDSARDEILNRDELKIVADSSSTTNSASATNDNPDSARLSEVNRQLQLAREELSATRLQSVDLTEQADELGATNENLDALVTLRQNEVARLEAQLSEARTAAADTAADASDAEATEIAGDSDAAGTVADATDAAETALEGTLGAVEDAGETLTEIDTSSAATDTTAAADAVVAAPETQVATPWYQDFLKNPMKMLIAGIGSLALLLLGFVLFRRKKPEPDDIDAEVNIQDVHAERDFDKADVSMDASMDAADAAVDGVADAGARGVDAVKGAAVAAGAAGIAAAGAGDLFGKDKDEVDPAETVSFADTDDTLDFGSETQAISDLDDDGIDKDDTISEVDVYLAYGLHGQAEELLNKAIDGNPDNPEYRMKLLETYHAQGNSEGFHAAASDYHQRFGGNSPEWEKIASLGVELRPGDSLYSSAASAVETMGTGQVGGAALDENDFAASDDSGAVTSSVSRDFTSAEEVVDFNSDDESNLMDQSIDPAFAFSEEDLEASGDFTAVAEEIADEAGTIEFPEFSDDVSSAGDAVKDAGSGGLAAGLAGAAGAAGAAALGGAGASLGDIAGSVGEKMDGLKDDGLHMDELDSSSVSNAANDSLDLSAVADDLTLDLDQLSTDMDLDGTELLGDGGAMNDLEIPDLTADNELLTGEGIAGDSDEMDTMMDLAKAYIDMGDNDSASSALGEIVKSGSPQQITEAETLLRKIS